MKEAVAKVIDTLTQDPLWPAVVALDRVLSMDQIEQTMCTNV